jgi:hypothetical protein
MMNSLSNRGMSSKATSQDSKDGNLAKPNCSDFAIAQTSLMTVRYWSPVRST